MKVLLEQLDFEFYNSLKIYQLPEDMKFYFKF